MFWILNQSVHRINYPCIYYVHSSETQMANGLLKWQFPLYSGMHACTPVLVTYGCTVCIHACMYAHMYTRVHTVWERSSGLQLCYTTEVLERNVPTHVTKTEDPLNSMDTNLQSVVFLEFYLFCIAMHLLVVIRWTLNLNFELLT